MSSTNETTRGANKTLTLIAMICAVSMTFIDQTIVSIAIPDIQQDLHLTESGVQWIVNGYLVALAAFFALGGRVADIFGHKRVVLIGVVVFAVASAMCGACPTGSAAEAWMIVWRVIQGAGAAFMFPAALAIVVSTYPREERGKAMAAFFGITGGFTALGPLVGGYLIEISWRTIFWINVPVAIAAVVLTLMAKPDNAQRPAPLDWKGAILVAIGVGSLVLGLQQASQWGWTSTATIACILIGLAGLALFVRAELQTDHPLMQVRIFSNSAFTTDAVILFLISMAFVPMFLFASMYSQISRGMTASQAGLYIGIYFLGFIAAAQYGGRLLDKSGARPSVLIGCAVATVGFVLWGQSMTDLSGGDYAQWWRMVIAGAGMGLVLGPVSTDALNRAPRTSYGEVTGITQTSRNIGASLGIAILGTLMIAQNKVNLEDAFAKLGIPKSTADKVADSMTQGTSAASGSGGAKSEQVFDAVKSSFAETTQTIFYGMAIAMALAFIVTLVRLPAGKPPEAEIIE